jgi:hypothetical protein
MKRLFAIFLFLPLAAHAAWGEFDYDFENEKPWKELESQLPAPPKDENLLPFQVSAATDNTFYVDSQSISVGEDGVVRFTLVVKSPEGASNVMFEGIRCRTKEVRLYAFGRSDGTWGKARDNEWKPIHYERRNRPDHVLYDDFFCPREIIVTDPAEAIDALKRGNHPRAGKSTWF